MTYPFRHDTVSNTIRLYMTRHDCHPQGQAERGGASREEEVGRMELHLEKNNEC